MGLNEATLAAHMMKHIFIPNDIPEPNNPERGSVLCQILEFRSAFTSYDRFNKDHYTFVRVPKKDIASQPHESDLRSRSDLTFTAYLNAIRNCRRDRCDVYPGVHEEYNGIGPFLSVEFKVDNEPAKGREAMHQIAISS